jgi:ribosomal protein L40E
METKKPGIRFPLPSSEDVARFARRGFDAQHAIDQIISRAGDCHPDPDDFLSACHALAAERAERARDVPQAERCRICNGTGSRTKYVLPGVTGPAECITCKGSGRA